MTQSALVACFLLSTVSTARSLDDREEESIGASVAPAVLPAAASAAYLYAGLSEIGGGYRYGLGLLEIEGRVRGDWRLLTLGAEALLKVSALEQGGWELGPFLGLGLGFDGGARYITRANFSYVAVRVLGGMNASYRVADTAYIVMALEMTLDLSVSPGNAVRFTPLAGGGAEFAVTPEVSLSVLGLIGPDLFHPRIGYTTTQLGYALRLGVGFRLF